VPLHLRDFRRANNLKQKDLAEALNISVNALSKYERGFESLPPQFLQILSGIGEGLPIVRDEAVICGEGYVTSKADNGRLIQRKSLPSIGKKYVFDLFCGIGGFSHGFEKSGEFENVVGLLTHAGGQTFKSISAAFEEIGYRTSARIMNGAHFGLPQKRERLILIGNRKGKSVDWPEATHWFPQRSMAGQSDLVIRPDDGLFGKKLVNAVTFSDATSDLPELLSGQKATSYTNGISLTDYQRTMRAGSKTLTLHEATKHSDKMLEIIRHAGVNIHALPKGMVTSGFSSCYSRLTANEPSTTITVNFVHPASNRCIHPSQNRALTPREGARLQSFEDSFRFMGSRSQTVKQIGNAVPPLLGKIVAETILRSD